LPGFCGGRLPPAGDFAAAFESGPAGAFLAVGRAPALGFFCVEGVRSGMSLLSASGKTLREGLRQV
jgi:hypothetical protein